MNEEQLRSALKSALSGAAFPAARQREVRSIITGETPMKARKRSLALVCALLLTLLMAGAALAAALGVFGTLAQKEENLYSSNRLQRLEEVSQTLQSETALTAPEAAQPSKAPQTVYQQLLSRQYGRSFDLTVQQAYCDGNKLYYSYTLTTNEAQFFQGEGRPDGFDEWLIEQPGKRYEEVWSNDVPGVDETITHWLNSHESSWIAREAWSLGDGAHLPDGTACDILNSSEQMLDEHTLQGYQEVQLPDGFSSAGSVTVELSVLYGTTLYYQDETGVYCAHIAQPENRGILRIPITVHRTGSVQTLTGEGSFDRYSARAELLVSEVDLSGRVELACPEAWTRSVANLDAAADYVEHYVLVADGVTQRNLNVSLLVAEPGRLVLTLRFDLPDSFAHLILRPVYFHSGECPQEDIVLSR